MNSKKITVAFADDHVGVREGIISLLNKQPDIKVVAEASQGAELLGLMSQLSSPPDIAILDINMPIMNGYETATAIRAQFPSVRIIAFSLYEDEFNIIRMIKSGALGYLCKATHSIADICKAIRNIIAKNYHYPGSVGKELFDKAQSTQLPDLNDKEYLFLLHCSEGLTNRQIAAKMGVSFRTVEHYYESLAIKLKVCCRVELVAFALRTGLIN